MKNFKIVTAWERPGAPVSLEDDEEIVGLESRSGVDGVWLQLYIAKPVSK
jgi:hypothetical protein